MAPPKQSHERYSDGTFVATRKKAQANYRDRQRAQREWISRFAEKFDVSKEELIELDPESIAEAYRHYMTPDNHSPGSTKSTGVHSFQEEHQR